MTYRFCYVFAYIVFMTLYTHLDTEPSLLICFELWFSVGHSIERHCLHFIVLLPKIKYM